MKKLSSTLMRNKLLIFCLAIVFGLVIQTGLYIQEKTMNSEQKVGKETTTEPQKDANNTTKLAEVAPQETPTNNSNQGSTTSTTNLQKPSQQTTTSTPQATVTTPTYTAPEYTPPPCNDTLRNMSKSNFLLGYTNYKNSKASQASTYLANISIIGPPQYTQAGYDTLVASNTSLIENYIINELASTNASLSSSSPTCAPITRTELNL